MYFNLFSKKITPFLMYVIISYPSL